MKSYSKGILVGISIILGSLLLMGYTSSNSEVGTYQVVCGEIEESLGGAYEDKSTCIKINTRTGETWEYYKMLLKNNQGQPYWDDFWSSIDK